MEETKVPQIFDEKAQSLARKRAQSRMAKTGPSFLLIRAAEDAASRIADINRQFERGVVLSSVDMRDTIISELPAGRQPKNLDWYDSLEAMNGEYDLIISLLELQTENDLPGALVRLRHNLKADGLFTAALFGGDSLSDLRQTLYTVDSAVFGGATARVYPMIDHHQAAALLGRAGLNLPVVDKDRVKVSYGKLETVVSDLRDLGLTNTLTARHKAPLPKGYLQAIKAAYPKTDDGKFPAQFEILWLTGWSPHESQQKPLKPGSAKMRLADALGTQEKKV
ncbi:SAM-dependent methyltransferase [Litorimonas haliclonae]|uniref:SAM-dependent methyltransferase n=1 Tax=Litorimonas haliclonae TaxID=2081977 RepID=UPI0039F07DD6